MSDQLLKQQNFGMELEFTGITRAQAAQVLADFFSSTAEHCPFEGYDTRRIKDQQGRDWKVVKDGSISIYGGEQCELVTPILKYEDIKMLQEVVRQIRKRGAKVNKSCGIHIHVDASKHTATSLRNLAFIMKSKEDLLIKALQINDGRLRMYCQKGNRDFIEKLKQDRTTSIDDINVKWYGRLNLHPQHYDGTRYHMLNLHAYWNKGTSEFRVFNATLHAGEIRAYINLCLAINAQALTQTRASSRESKTGNDKYRFRCWLLRLGMIGDEFKTTRDHLLKHLDGNSAWLNDPQSYDSYNNRRATV